jgi:type VI protein secretion system component Hcp
MADTLIFLKVIGDDPKGPPEIKGESTAAGFKDQIELESVEWRVSIPSTSGTPTGAPVQPKFEEVTLEKHVDIASCTLLQYANTKKRRNPKDAVKQMAITYVDMVLSADGTSSSVPVVEFMLHQCHFESISMSVTNSGKGSVALRETVIVSYEKIDIVYHPVGRDRRQRGAAMTFRGLAAGTK